MSVLNREINRLKEEKQMLINRAKQSRESQFEIRLLGKLNSR